MSEIYTLDIPLFKKLLQQELLSETEFENIEKQQHQPVSVHWEVTTLLYLGILLFAGSLGILIYKNIDSIGHSVILSVIALVCSACFAYCFKKAKGYSNQKIESSNLLFYYVVLLGCLLLLTFVGYLQFEYKLFGNDWGLATFIPMVLLFMAAYYFDHTGVLSMAIANLAAWAGFTVAPVNILSKNDFNDSKLIYTAIVLSVGLLAISFVSIVRRIKVHFALTYKSFGAHILFISLLAALFHFNTVYLIWFVIFATAVILFLKNAIKEKSFYFLVITVLYGYIGVSYVAGSLLWAIDGGEAVLYLSFIYFIASGIGLIRMLIHYNKIFKKDVHL